MQKYYLQCKKSKKNLLSFILIFLVLILNNNCSKQLKQKQSLNTNALKDVSDLEKTIIKKLFINKKEERKFFKRHRSEKRLYGKKKHIKKYKKINMAGTVIEQRSGRKRLYDHNLFLRALFDGRMIHKEFGNLKNLFINAVFLDFGSAVLFADGAPTVRDIYEDKLVKPFLSRIIATDINDMSSKKTQYINLYKERNIVFPFRVLEIPMSITQLSQIYELLKLDIKNKDTAIIFRSTNSGPDLFYTSFQVKQHFKAILKVSRGRNILYFFNKFILFKAKNLNYFEILGTIDTSVGLARRGSKWKKINWKKRKLKSAFKNNRKYIKIKECYYW